MQDGHLVDGFPLPLLMSRKDINASLNDGLCLDPSGDWASCDQKCFAAGTFHMSGQDLVQAMA